jgi:RNA polymerase sigma-70 factor (ECF subfamily)
MALQLCRNETQAGDLVQETYLRAWRALERFEERPGGLKAWLFRILHNTFFSEIERARRRPLSIDPTIEAGTDQAPRRSAAAAPPGEPLPAWDLRSFDWEHIDDRLKEALDRLRPEFREVLLLWAVEGLKYREIAGILEVPIGTIMSRLHRARAVLAEELKDLAEERRIGGGL